MACVFTRCLAFVVVFFFQAEDGIRDYKVTGVQTVCSSDLRPRHLGQSAAHVAIGARSDGRKAALLPRRGRCLRVWIRAASSPRASSRAASAKLRESEPLSELRVRS